MSQLPSAIPAPQENASEDLLGLWSDLESALSIVLAEPHATQEFPHKIVQFDRWMQDLVRQDSDTAVYLLFQLAATSSVGYSASHALVCATLCHLVAAELRLAAAERDALVHAAMTMNVAMTQLQDALAVQEEKPSSAQRAIIGRHTAEGVSILQRLGVSDVLWLEIVRDHHAEQRGSRLQDWATWAAARRLPHVLAAIDRYAAMISPRAGRAGRSASDSVEALLDGRSGSYPAAIGQALLRAVGRFPPGSFVMLESGEVAVVIRHGAQDTGPSVAVLRDAAGEPMRQPRLVQHAGRIREPLTREQAAVPHSPLRLLQIGLRAGRLFRAGWRKPPLDDETPVI